MFQLMKPVISQKKLLDNTLHLRTTLSPENIYDLLKLCLPTTCFQCREKFYEQTHGALMGSPLSPVRANLFMEEFEKKALVTSTLKSGFWFRYVDDTLSSWAHGLENLHRFLEHINSLHQVQFTLEIQKEVKTIPFLDVLLLTGPPRELAGPGAKFYSGPL